MHLIMLFGRRTREPRHWTQTAWWPILVEQPAVAGCRQQTATYGTRLPTSSWGPSDLRSDS